MNMLRYIAKRMIISIPVLIGITAICLSLLNVIPGDPVALMMKEHIGEDVIVRVRCQMHLDDPAICTLFSICCWGNSGRFYLHKLKRPVTGLILQAFPNTMVLAISAALFSWIVGIPAVSFRQSDNIPEPIISLWVFLARRLMPIFWSALLMQYIFALKLRWLPVSGFYG